MTGGLERQAASAKMCLACNREFQEDIQKCPHDGTSLISLKMDDDWVGKTLGDRYEITDMLGKGGMGLVYLARHKNMDRLVAVKMLQSELAQDEVSVKRFQQEAKAASCLNHPHLVTLHDYGIAPTGQPYLVMEYLEGRSLLEVIKHQGPLSPSRAAKIFAEVADGLYHAHQQGIVHRDLKPSNILLVDQEGDPEFAKVVDFGLAKLMPWSGKESQHLTKTGEVFGSPIYMSPEQCMGRELRPTSDIYSLGVTLFESLTGKPPFRGPNSIATASAHMSQPPPHFADIRPDLDLPAALEKVVLTSLAKEPSARFQDMREFKDALVSSVSSRSTNNGISKKNLQAAMGSTVAIPVMKTEQDKLRQSLSIKGGAIPESGISPQKKMLAMAAGVLVAGVLAVGGFFFMQGQSSNLKGQIYMVTHGGDGIAALVFDPSTKSRQLLPLSQPAEHDLVISDTSVYPAKVGAEIEGKVDAATKMLQSVDVKNNDNSVAKAYIMVQQLLENLAHGDQIPAGMLADPDEAKLNHLFENIQQVNTMPVLHEGNPRTIDKFRALNGIVVEGSDSNGVRILVNQNYYCTTEDRKRTINKIVRFICEGDKLRYEKADERDWLTATQHP